MKLLAISGGVDSMTLAHLYRKEKNIILAFVNYNFRADTWKDQQIVEEFANKNNLILEKLILDAKQQQYQGNFQNWARKIRYDFFKSLYVKYNCNQLLIAHHKDDFLETCLMQQKKNKNKLFYGIKQKTIYLNMNVYRPLLFKYWKTEIYEYAKKNKINFNDDWTNFQSKYQRNQIRNILLKNKSINEKQQMLNEFIKQNKQNEQKELEIKNEYLIWSNEKFSKKSFSLLKNKKELVIFFINSNLKNINLNRNIIESIIQFILSNENKKEFKLNNGHKLIKINNKLLIN